MHLQLEFLHFLMQSLVLLLACFQLLIVVSIVRNLSQPFSFKFIFPMLLQVSFKFFICTQSKFKILL